MAFASQALTEHWSAGRKLAVAGPFKVYGWRFIVLLRVYTQCHRALVVSDLYLLWLSLAPYRFMISALARATEIMKSPSLRNFLEYMSAFRGDISKTALSIFAHFSNLSDTASGDFFWRCYFVFAKSLDTFIEDYSEAWRQRPEVDREIILFVDNGFRSAVPVSSVVGDKELVERIRTFYELTLAKGGLASLLGFKESIRVDIVEIEQTFAVGKRIGEPLHLGRYGSYNRQIHYFRDPSKLTGTAIRDRLIEASVMTAPGQQLLALNVVRTWNPNSATVTVLVPVILSLIISVVWTIVATVHFKADVQMSTQTGFTIGSYVVTAGALLIALVAFLDTKYNAGD